MGYTELLKLYYGDKNAYNAEYRSRFGSSDAVKLNFNIKNNRAFFIINAEVAGIAIQILKTDKRVCLLSGDLPGVALGQFKKRCLIDEIILTNKIEGVHSTRKEITSILDDLEDAVKKKTTRRRFWGLVNQYNKLETENHFLLKSCQDVRELYDELVLAEVVKENPRNAPDGEIFRKDHASVTAATDKEIHRGTYPEKAICEDVEAALEFLNNGDIELLYRLSIFHYLLGYIHPFYDGNGRLGRFIVSGLLSQELNQLLAYRLSYTIAENISQYYNAFKVCNDPHNLGDVTPFLVMMLNMINRAALQLEDALRNRHNRFDRYEKIIATLPGGTKDRTKRVYHVLIQAGLFSEHGISTRELEVHLGNSYTTIMKELEIISGGGLLIKNKVGNENYYMVDLEKLDQVIPVA